MSFDGPEPAERLTAAMDIWLRHRHTPDCSDIELLDRHQDLQDLLEPLIASVREGEPLATDSHRRFGSYRLLAEIGRGGVGVVYQAVQEPLGRHVALKLLSDGLLHHPQAVARFRREGGLLARLQHANIVPVFDAGVVDGIPYHAMERVDGASLHHVLQRLRHLDAGACDGATLAEALANELNSGVAVPQGDIEIGSNLRARSHVEAAVRLVHTIATALVAAHQEGILHRDVKPANILLRRDGTAKLSDFGLARDLREPGLTQAGGFVGTPSDVSPEQAAGRIADVDERSDVFSLAVVLYELLVLARPFDGDTSEEVLAQVQRVDPHRLLRNAAGLPKDLLAVLDCALQRDREDRYASMAAFADDLDAVLELRPVQSRRRSGLSRAWQSVRRRPKQSVMWAALSVSSLVALSLWVHLSNQQARIDAGLLGETMPKVEQHLELAMLDAEAHNWSAASERIAAAAKLVPDLPIVIAAQAHVLWQSGQLQELQPLLDRLQAVAPEVASQLQQDAKEPITSLGWFVRGWRQVSAAHSSGDPEEFGKAAQSFRRAIDRSPQPRSLYHCQYLHALIHLHDWPAIRAMAADIGHLWPDSAAVAYWRGFALTGIDPEFAKRELERACRELPGLPDPAQRLAKLLEIEGDLAGAEQLMRGVVQQHPHLPLPRLILARLLRKQHRAEDALAFLETPQADSSTTWRLPVEQASVLAVLGRVDEAMEAANAAVLASPRAPQVYERRADLLLQLQRPAEALADADRACAMAPTNFDCHRTRARICIRMGRYEEAAKSLRQVVALNPRDKGSFCDLATMCRRTNDLDAADAALEQAAAIDPNYWMLHLQRGHVRQAQQRPEAARESFQQAADRNPEHAEALINLAGFHMAAQEYDQGLSLLAEARRRQPDLWQGFRPAIAILAALGRHQESEAVLRAWCEQHQQDGARWLQLAQLRRNAPTHDAASVQAALQHAEKLLGEDDPAILAERGELLLLAGDKEQARGLFARVVAMKQVPSKLRDACQARLNE